MLCLVASKIWRFSSLLNKQPLHPLQLNPNAASSVSVRRPFGKAEHGVLPSWRGREGEICCWLSENPWHIFGYRMQRMWREVWPPDSVRSEPGREGEEEGERG